MNDHREKMADYQKGISIKNLPDSSTDQLRWLVQERKWETRDAVIMGLRLLWQEETLRADFDQDLTLDEVLAAEPKTRGRNKLFKD